MDIEITIERISIRLIYPDEEKTEEAPEATTDAEPEQDEWQRSLSGWVETKPRQSPRHSGGGRTPVPLGARNHCSNCGAPGRRALERLGGKCKDCVDGEGRL